MLSSLIVALISFTKIYTISCNTIVGSSFGNFEYSISANNNVTITGYSGSDNKITIKTRQKLHKRW